MERCFGKRVVQLLRLYLKFCGACGFVIFTYNDRKMCVETSRWRRRVGLAFACLYCPVALSCLLLFENTPHSCKYLLFIISTTGVQFNLMYSILMQRFYTHTLMTLLNDFRIILNEVHKVSRHEIIFSRLFEIRSVLQFCPMFIVLFNVAVVRPPLRVWLLLVVIKVLPDILVEMLHHSVYIALYAVAKMFENLNEAITSKRKANSEKIFRVYYELHRFAEKLNQYLYGYFLLHFFMDCFLLAALVVTIKLECSSKRSMLILAASTLNRMRTLMMVGDEINEKSRFFKKNGDHRIEFSMIGMNLRLCGAYAIDKKMFMSMIAKIFLFVIVTNQYLIYYPDGYSNYLRKK